MVKIGLFDRRSAFDRMHKGGEDVFIALLAGQFFNHLNFGDRGGIKATDAGIIKPRQDVRGGISLNGVKNLSGEII